MIARYFDFSLKPGSCPESPDSRIIPARQKISSRKGGGGVLATAPRDARVLPFLFVSKENPIFRYSQVAGFTITFFVFQAEDGIRDGRVTGVQTCALPI